MSVFSMIKRGRQAAKEHKATQAEKQKAQVVKLPYKHVPTHAATDAMAAAPAAARMADREKILEQNRRRSAMTANGIGMSNHGSYSIMTPVRTGMMRAHSSMIFTSSPVVYSDITPVTKNHSLGSMNAAWAPQPTEPRLLPAASSTVSSKGKEVEMPAVLETGHPSNVSRKGLQRHSHPHSPWLLGH